MAPDGWHEGLPGMDDLIAISSVLNGETTGIQVVCTCATGTAGPMGCPVHSSWVGPRVEEARTGWRCPDCGTHWSPDVDCCRTCSLRAVGNDDTEY